MLTLFIGDSNEELPNWIRSQDYGDSILLTNENFNLIKTKDIFHTSFADLDSDNLINAIKIAKEVIYHQPDQWSSEQLHIDTERHFIGCGRIIKNFNGDVFGLLDIEDKQESLDKKTLWIAGCSYANGQFIDKSQRYGRLLANKLNLPVKFLTKDGSSIDWAADQLLRSPIKENDIVVWGITGVNRYMYYYNMQEVCGITNTYLDKTKPEIDSIELRRKLVDDERIMTAIQSIFQVQNFCRSINATLLVCPHYNLSIHKFREILEYYILNNFINLELTPFCDTGEDGRHPGPQTNYNWANEIEKKLKEI